MVWREDPWRNANDKGYRMEFCKRQKRRMSISEMEGEELVWFIWNKVSREEEDLTLILS
jgi:hypothetical protein